MKSGKIYIIMLTLLLVALSVSCAPSTSSATTTQQVVTVQRGTLRQEVTTSGNLALSKTADCAFQVAGYVYRVVVEAGDPVKQGQLLAEADPYDWDSQKGTLERAVVQAKINVNTAQTNLEKAQNPTTTTSTISGAISAPDPLDIETKQLQLQQAQMALDGAQTELDRFLQTSPQVLAPFDGFVTAVNVKGGDEVYKGSIAVSVADPAMFETEILVNEMDINQIEIGMPATVQVMSSPASRFPAKVTKIAPTATNQSGVVNYAVEVELLSADEIRQLRNTQTQVNPPSQSGQPSSGQNTSGQSQSRQFSRQTTSGSSQSTANAPLTLEQLRDGLSVTVNIVVQEKQNVLLVPNRAIKRQGMDYVVEIPKGETTETRVVKTGISDTQSTEIVEGLDEGDQVVISQTTTSTTTTPAPQSRGQSFGSFGAPNIRPMP